MEQRKRQFADEHDQVLYERWQQIGAELGFATAAPVGGQPNPQMSEAWAG